MHDGQGVRNDRLATAMAARALTQRGLAERLLVDVKTVDRWLGGRMPQPRHRAAVAAELEQPESYLWPCTTSVGRDPLTLDTVGLITVYPHRTDVPQQLWRSLLDRARERIDVLAYAALFLAEENPELVGTLAAKNSTLNIRVALGDPACRRVAERGEEEELFDGMASRIRTTLRHLRPLADCPGVTVHLHSTTLYNSIFRFDDEMLVNAHVYAGPAFRSPVLHLRQTPGYGLFQTYVDSFDAVWRNSVPLDPQDWNIP
jgi:transcriptional regulator with XRE-family HTH domain